MLFNISITLLIAYRCEMLAEPFSLFISAKIALILRESEQGLLSFDSPILTITVIVLRLTNYFYYHLS